MGPGRPGTALRVRPYALLPTPGFDPKTYSSGTANHHHPAFGCTSVTPPQYVKQANKTGRHFYVNEEVDRLKAKRDADKIRELLKREAGALGGAGPRASVTW